MHPTTDIVCLVHNQWSVTDGFINAVFENTQNFNLIFVDNNSTDETSKKLQDGSDQNRWSYVRLAENMGIIKGRNIGATHVKSDWFVNLDNDQYPQKGWLDELHDLANRFDVVGCEAWRLEDPSCPKIAKYFPIRKCMVPTESFSYIGCGGMLIPKFVYRKIGLFDERFSPAFFEDPDFSFRLIQNGFTIGWAYNCKINHLEHKTLPKQSDFDHRAQFSRSLREFQNKWNPFYPQPITMEGEQKCEAEKK